MIYKKLMIATLMLALSVAGLAPAAGAQGDPPSTAAQPERPVTVEGPTTPGAPEPPGSPEPPSTSNNRAVTSIGVGSKLVSTAFGGQTVALDVASAAARTRVTDVSGATVVSDAIGDVDLKITTSNSGFAVAAELESVDSPHQLRFDVSIPEGAILVLTEEGSVDVVGRDGFTLGAFAAPWAVDTNGSDVTTSYSVDGKTIIQTVDSTAKELYPVIADPKFTWGIITGTVYFDRNETENICIVGFVILLELLLAATVAWQLVAAALIGWKVVSRACAANLLSKCLKIKSTGSLGIYSGDYCT